VQHNSCQFLTWTKNFWPNVTRQIQFFEANIKDRQKSFYLKNFKHYYILKMRPKFNCKTISTCKQKFSLEETWRGNASQTIVIDQQSALELEKSNCGKTPKSTSRSLKKMCRKNQMATLLNFFSTNMTSIHKRKKWSIIIILKRSKINFELHWWTHERKNQNRARNSWIVMISHCFKSSKRSI